jgi:hypothetical protein
MKQSTDQLLRRIFIVWIIACLLLSAYFLYQGYTARQRQAELQAKVDKLVSVIKSVEPTQSKPSSLATPGLAEVEIPLNVPSDSTARYFILEKGGKGALRTIVTKRVGSSGTSYSTRLYNCVDNTVKYLGTGDSLEAMRKSYPDPNMGSVIQGSIAYYVANEACRP